MESENCKCMCAECRWGTHCSGVDCDMSAGEQRMVWCVECGHTPFRHDIKAGCFMCGCKRFRLAEEESVTNACISNWLKGIDRP